ncbi:MAG: lantibiotic dehydratase [Blastocatellia bacterium]
MIANYWQRYCAKNDTIGFFGPVGWARFVPEGEPVNARSGPTLLANRRVFFEVWCIDALAEMLAAREEFMPWLLPRRPPGIRLEGETLYSPSKKPFDLPANEAEVLKTCGGEKTARQIADELLRYKSNLFTGEIEIYQLLRELRNRELILLTPPIPSGARPDEALRRALDRIEDESIHKQMAEPLLKLEASRDEVACAAGHPEKLELALSQMESLFTGLTGMSATRAEGKTYAGRTLVYEDCRRDTEVEIGPQIVDALARPLSLILNSARWFTFNAASRYKETLEEVYRDLATQTGSSTVEASSFWARMQAALYGSKDDPSLAIQSTLQERWSEILRIAPEQKSLNYSSEQLLPRVLESFPAPRPGWQYARYHSPDVMIATRGIDALRRGEFQLVLGEMHIAVNTLSWAFFLEQHPCPVELFRAVELDLPEPRLAPMPPKYWPGRTSRCQNVLLSPKDTCLEFASDSPGLLDSRSLPIGAFVVTRDGGEIVIRDREGSMQFSVLDTFAEGLMSQVVNAFKIKAPGQHTPRVTIDRLVVSRESWLFAPSDLSFAFEKSEPHRFLAARRWAGSLGLPRFLFFKSPVEVKPCFLDLHSPIFVNLFSRIIRRTFDSDPEHPISVSEMLPAPDQVWLPDASGNLYSCELRIVAVDLFRRERTC